MGIYPSGTPQDGLQRISCLQKEVSAIVEFVPHTSHMINIYNLQKASMMILTLVLLSTDCALVSVVDRSTRQHSSSIASSLYRSRISTCCRHNIARLTE